MPKKENEKLTLHSIYLYQGDFAELNGLYGGKMPASKLIRVLVRKTIQKIKDQAAQDIAFRAEDVEITDLEKAR